MSVCVFAASHSPSAVPAHHFIVSGAVLTAVLRERRANKNVPLSRRIPLLNTELTFKPVALVKARRSACLSVCLLCPRLFISAGV